MMTQATFTKLSAVALTALLFTGCGEDNATPEQDDTGCDGGKCDDPNTVAQDGCVLEARAAIETADAIAANCEAGESNNACRTRVFQTCRDNAAVALCEGRRGEALECTAESRGTSFDGSSIRWQCADVNGVSRGSKFDSSLPGSDAVQRGEGRGAGIDRLDEDESAVDFSNKPDSRGQEYCEYFALVQLPDEDEPREIGRLLSGGNSTTDHDLSEELTDDLRDMLDDEDDAVFGQCVFTSWHQDVTKQLEICSENPAACDTMPPAEDSASWVPEEGMKFGLNRNNLAMKVGINSNNAAMDLVDNCMVDPSAHSKPAPLSTGVEDEFGRGCLRTYELFTTEWRRSDPAICTAAMRLTECGCGVDVDGDGVADVAAGDKLSNGREALSRVLVPSVEDDSFLRGFPLGTWSDAEALPDGCRFVDITSDGSTVNGGKGEHGQNVVACDITSERIESAGFTVSQAFSDMKTFCQSSYAQDVVVHIPIQGNHIPEASLVCDPPAGAANCEGLPIAIGAENGSQRAGLCDVTLEPGGEGGEPEGEDPSGGDPEPEPEPAGDSCEDRCGGFDETLSCQCDDVCADNGDCCDDIGDWCE